MKGIQNKPENTTVALYTFLGYLFLQFQLKGAEKHGKCDQRDGMRNESIE